MFSQEEIDGMSDGLKRAARRHPSLAETEIAAWFINTDHGPEFLLGIPSRGDRRLQPLFFVPAREGQLAVAWREADGSLITGDVSVYRDDMRWLPLYLAR